MTLYWRALAEMGKDYTVFTHLIDEENRIWAQHDSQPQGGRHPTSRWFEGEVVIDQYELILAGDAPPGEYQIEVGMYNWASGERLALVDRNGNVIGDKVLLEKIKVL